MREKKFRSTMKHSNSELLLKQQGRPPMSKKKTEMSFSQTQRSFNLTKSLISKQGD